VKRELKGFVMGFLVCIMITSTVFAGGVTKTIEVVFDKVNIEVNSQKMESSNFLYEGTTYVPIRAVAEVLGKEVGWDHNSKTASINDIIEKVSIEEIDIVAEKIKAKAAKDWPDNFQMQKFQIEQETEAYNTIRGLINTPDYNSDILKKAIDDWSDSYQMQKYQYEKQLEAYKELNE